MLARLVTFVDVDDVSDSQLSFSARHDALLTDGRRIVLLDDRGWSQSRILVFSKGEVPPPAEPSSPWEGVTRARIEENARIVVGPDAAYAAYTQDEMDDAHWRHLSGALAEHGVQVDADELAALPHQVELSDRLVIRLSE